MAEASHHSAHSTQIIGSPHRELEACEVLLCSRSSSKNLASEKYTMARGTRAGRRKKPHAIRKNVTDGSAMLVYRLSNRTGIESSMVGSNLTDGPGFDATAVCGKHHSRAHAIDTAWLRTTRRCLCQCRCSRGGSGIAWGDKAQEILAHGDAEALSIG